MPWLCLFAHVQAVSLSLAALSTEEGAKEAGGDDDEEEDDLFETEFRQYKRTYYMTKIGVDVVSEWVVALQLMIVFVGD